MRAIRQLICAIVFGHDLEFVRNVYGDEIHQYGGNRSRWECRICGARRSLPDLHKSAEPRT